MRISGIFGLLTLISPNKRYESPLLSHIVLTVSFLMLSLQPSVGTEPHALCPTLTFFQFPVIKAQPKPLTIKAEFNPLVIKAEPQPLMIKPEPAEDRPPSRKRSGTVSILREVVPKKIKADPEGLPMPGLDIEPLHSMSTKTIRDELTDLQAKINHLQPQLDRARRKSEKTTEKLTREKNLTSQLIDLYKRKKELTEMIPAVSAPLHPIAGPSYQNNFDDGFAQPMQPPASMQPYAPSVPVASGSNLPFNFFKDELMDTNPDSDNTTPPPTSDLDLFHPFGEGDINQTITAGSTSGVDLGVDFYHYNAAKADEWVRCIALSSLLANVSLQHQAIP
jgi:hypothetical protein